MKSAWRYDDVIFQNVYNESNTLNKILSFLLFHVIILGLYVAMKFQLSLNILMQT